MEDPETNNIHSNIKWIPLSITAEYPEGDLIGKLLAFSSMVPHALIVSFITLILFRRDLHTISYLLGLVLNEGINYVLKHTLRQGRPLVRPSLLHEYGMPSSHSQFMWFFTTYMFLFIWVRLRHISYTNTIWICIWKTAISVACLVASIIVAIARIYLQYHTASQVIVGGLLGSVLAVSWFLFTQFALTPWFPTVASWRVCEWLLVRDQTLIPNIIWFEYTSHRSESKHRSRKLVSMKSQ
ncbi:dolichyldiphosphatase 1-like [Daphnia pulex]|uniref:dolichyldiphosphatase 1-like n=1 Tax=Daphnia pulex TaxID=6669 RepID=UPI001EE05732|nr:dolichyldiphosphatase 1-like [Daphnia pulex]XP_046655496.1 dolichyldiphosphatase 1-like [Daphnia pulicaria]